MPKKELDKYGLQAPVRSPSSRAIEVGGSRDDEDDDEEPNNEDAEDNEIDESDVDDEDGDSETDYESGDNVGFDVRPPRDPSKLMRLERDPPLNDLDFLQEHEKPRNSQHLRLYQVYDNKHWLKTGLRTVYEYNQWKHSVDFLGPAAQGLLQATGGFKEPQEVFCIAGEGKPPRGDDPCEDEPSATVAQELRKRLDAFNWSMAKLNAQFAKLSKGAESFDFAFR